MADVLLVVKATLVRRGPRDPRGELYTLRMLREAADKTQDEVADGAEMPQAEVSRLEACDDAKLSALRRYARALGAEVDVVFVFPKTGHRMRVDLKR